MARLERPKGYSRELWKKLKNQIRNIKRFVKEKTETGATVKNVPDVEDVYSAKGRKKIREWSAKKQWESTEYVQRETGEKLTGKEAKKAWSEYRKEKRERKQEQPPASEDVKNTYEAYGSIMSQLSAIPNRRPVGERGSRGWYWIDTGGLRDTLIDMLNDLYAEVDEADAYIENNKEAISDNIQAIVQSSDQNDVNYAYNDLLRLFNGGYALSKKQWDDLQSTELNY